MSTLYAYPYTCAFAFLLLVVGIGLFLIWVAEMSPARRLLHSCAGVAAPIASLLALFFGLFSAFLANDAWLHTDRARAAVTREANAIAVVVTIADGLGARGQELGRMAVAFGRRTTAGDWKSAEQTAAADALGIKMLREVMFGGLAGADAPVRQAALASIMEMRAARSDMVSAEHSQTSRLKWIAALVLGILTQVGVVIIHIGKPRSAILAVALFSCGMAFMLWVILMRLDPFGGKNAVSLTPISAAYESFAPR